MPRPRPRRQAWRSATSKDLSSLTKKELYDRAGQRGVAGRSSMSKNQIAEAVAKAS